MYRIAVSYRYGFIKNSYGQYSLKVTNFCPYHILKENSKLWKHLILVWVQSLITFLAIICLINLDLLLLKMIEREKCLCLIILSSLPLPLLQCLKCHWKTVRKLIWNTLLFPALSRCSKGCGYIFGLKVASRFVFYDNFE